MNEKSKWFHSVGFGLQITTISEAEKEGFDFSRMMLSLDMRTAFRIFPVLVFFLLVGYSLSNHLSGNRNKPVVISDGKGYFAYMPAIFIYGDLQFEFQDAMEKKYYPADGSLKKGYITDLGEGQVNKYFCGSAIAMTPMFLLAHGLSYMIGADTDGFSWLYQFSVVLSACMFLAIGLFFLMRVLRDFGFGDPLILVIAVIMVFGTNLFHYSVAAPYMSHVYSFAVNSMLIRQFQKLRDHLSLKTALLAAALYGFAIIIRPVNVLVLLSLPFFFTSWDAFREWITRAFSRERMTVVLSLITVFLVTCIQFVLWYLQSGHFIVDSYAGEEFDFFFPPMIKCLFSVRKGWFIYTPAALLSLPGLVVLWNKNRFRAVWLSGFLFIVLYVVSSWYLWGYADSFGQRPFIDFYAFTAVLMAFALNWIASQNRILKVLTGCFVMFCIALNVVQNYQMSNAIIPGDHMTWQLYRESFFRLHPEAKARVDLSKYRKIGEVFNNFEEDRPNWTSWEYSISDEAFSGIHSTFVDEHLEFSMTYKDILPLGTSMITIESVIFTRASDMAPFLNLVLKNTDGEVKESREISMDYFMRTNLWFEAGFAVSLKHPSEVGDRVEVFFWHPKKNGAIYIDDVRLSFYSNR